MKNHKVLIATYYWPPSGGPGVHRYLKFTKYLFDFGIEPIVLTVKNPTYPSRDESLATEIPKNLKVYKSKTIEPFGIYAKLKGEKPENIKPTVEIESDSFTASVGSWIRANLFIPDARAGWLLAARPQAESLVNQYDIQTVITTGPPHSFHFIGKHLQKKFGIRWLADFRDPWTQVYYNQILPRTFVANKIDEILEKSILSQADEVIAVTPSQAEKYRKISERDYHVITNGFDPEDFKQNGVKRKQSPSVLIRHIGNIRVAAVPEMFLKAVKAFENRLDLNVEFIGDNNPRLEKLIMKFKLQNTVFLKDYQPHKIATQKMTEADILVLYLPDVDDIHHHIPGKLFEYIGSGRPVLMLGPVDGDSAAILKKEQAGIACDINDFDAIKKALKRLIDQISSAARAVDMENHPYSIIQLTERLSRLILSESENPESEIHHKRMVKV